MTARFESPGAGRDGVCTEAALDNYLGRTFDRGLLDILARREVRRVRINDRRTVFLLKSL